MGQLKRIDADGRWFSTDTRAKLVDIQELLQDMELHLGDFSDGLIYAQLERAEALSSEAAGLLLKAKVPDTSALFGRVSALQRDIQSTQRGLSPALARPRLSVTSPEENAERLFHEAEGALGEAVAAEQDSLDKKAEQAESILKGRDTDAVQSKWAAEKGLVSQSEVDSTDVPTVLRDLLNKRKGDIRPRLDTPDASQLKAIDGDLDVVLDGCDRSNERLQAVLAKIRAGVADKVSEAKTKYPDRVGVMKDKQIQRFAGKDHASAIREFESKPNLTLGDLETAHKAASKAMSSLPILDKFWGQFQVVEPRVGLSRLSCETVVKTYLGDDARAFCSNAWDLGLCQSLDKNNNCPVPAQMGWMPA